MTCWRRQLRRAPGSARRGSLLSRGRAGRPAPLAEALQPESRPPAAHGTSATPNPALQALRQRCRGTPAPPGPSCRWRQEEPGGWWHGRRLGVRGGGGAMPAAGPLAGKGGGRPVRGGVPSPTPNQAACYTTPTPTPSPGGGGWEERLRYSSGRKAAAAADSEVALRDDGGRPVDLGGVDDHACGQSFSCGGGASPYSKSATWMPRGVRGTARPARPRLAPRLSTLSLPLRPSRGAVGGALDSAGLTARVVTARVVT